MFKCACAWSCRCGCVTMCVGVACVYVYMCVCVKQGIYASVAGGLLEKKKKPCLSCGVLFNAGNMVADI